MTSQVWTNPLEILQDSWLVCIKNTDGQHHPLALRFYNQPTKHFVMAFSTVDKLNAMMAALDFNQYTVVLLSHPAFFIKAFITDTTRIAFDAAIDTDDQLTFTEVGSQGH